MCQEIRLKTKQRGSGLPSTRAGQMAVDLYPRTGINLGTGVELEAKLWTRDTGSPALA